MLKSAEVYFKIKNAFVLVLILMLPPGWRHILNYFTMST